ncbi:hypothetical protein ACFQS6_10190 [Xanthomonas populi]
MRAIARVLERAPSTILQIRSAHGSQAAMKMPTG